LSFKNNTLKYKEIQKTIKKKNKTYLSIRNLFEKHHIIKFVAVILLLVGYSLYVATHYGIKGGFLIGIITWSFFVLCTPIADAGILIDFPMRLITGIKMVSSEIVVWAIAIGVNVFVFISNPEIYKKTKLLTLFKRIIDNPIPFWTVIFLSMIGTFLSLYIVDSMMDTKKRRKKHVNYLIKHKRAMLILIFILVLVIYYFLLAPCLMLR